MEDLTNITEQNRRVYVLNSDGQHTNEMVEVTDNLNQVQEAIYSADAAKDNSLAPPVNSTQEPEALNGDNRLENNLPPKPGGQNP